MLLQSEQEYAGGIEAMFTIKDDANTDNRSMRKRIVTGTGLACLLVMLVLMAPNSASFGQSDPLPGRLKIMQTELKRNFEALQKQDVPPYYISYTIDEVRTRTVAGSFGAIASQNENTTAQLRVGLRTGSYELDNTRELRSNNSLLSALTSALSPSSRAPLGEGGNALAVILWQATDDAYKNAVERLSQVKSAQNTQMASEDQSDDFSRAEPQTFLGKPADALVDLDKWAGRIRTFTAQFKNHPFITAASGQFQNEIRNKYFVDTEGAVLLVPAGFMRLGITANVRAADGTPLPLYLSYFGYSESDLPSEESILKDISGLIDNLEKLCAAPVIDPYTGPAILSGRSAGVFFHEILGHRLEGQRLKSDTDGQTFKKRVGEQILPPFLSVSFDPTIRELDKFVLSGAYQFDDEGVRAEKVVAVSGGVLKNFLMSRTPIAGFSRSNGHGRAQPGSAPASRQSNLIVESTNMLPESKLRQMLIEECKKQDKPFGLFISEVQGGQTATARSSMNAFNINPLVVYRIYADGRPDELVRGVNLAGTPLAAFGKIVATGDRREVFNGTCGAESGSIPVSALSPSILISEIEVQKRAATPEKPPILPPPDMKNPTGKGAR